MPQKKDSTAAPRPTKAKFKTKILTAGKTATGIKIPPQIIEQLGGGKKPPVKVTFNGYTYRSTVAVMGGAFMVGVNAGHRAASGVAGGDEVDVTLELDTAPREVEIPADFKKALKANAKALQNFETISYSKKKAYVLPILDAKTDETRLRRIEKAIAELQKGK